MEPVHDDLRDLVRAAERVAVDAGLDAVAAWLRECRAERDRPGTRVAVVGDFNRGKSTMVNRLVGADVLPTGNVPLTRGFVVVRVLAEGPAVLDIRWPSGAAERRSLAAGDPWQGLVLDHEPTAVRVAEGQTGPAEPEVLLSVPSDWLARAEIELIDTPGLHEGRVDHLLQTRRAVAFSDVAVMAISALSPLSQLERQFLEEELLVKRVPHVIAVLTKADQLPPDETGEFTDWFRARIAEVSPDIAVAIGPGPSAGAEALAVLRDQIRDLAHAGDVIRRRDLRLAWQITDACAAIRSAAGAARDQLKEDEAARHAGVTAAKQELSDDDLRWNQLRLGLDERRLGFIETIREAATSAAAELFETLDAELHRVTDIKAWWEQELPVRLRRELRNLTRALETQLSATISRDLSWLDTEVARSFGMPGKLAAARPAAPVAAAELPVLELEDIRRRRTATRIVTAAGGIAGAALAFASGIGMPAAFTIGGSAIAGVLAERDADAKTGEQRALVRAHVRRLLDDVVDQFKDKLSTEVERSYRVAFDELRVAQATWRTTRLEALAATTGTGPDVTAWTDIEHRIDDIAGRIPADLGREPPPGSAGTAGGLSTDQNDQEGDPA
jgi:hypothetical protein